VTACVAEAVVREARDSGLGRRLADDEIAPAIRAATWEPVYPRLDPVDAIDSEAGSEAPPLGG
jgi:hypothetical protein